MHILSVNYSEETQGYSNHHHDAHELLYVVSGEITVNIGGEEYYAKEGSLLIFSRFEEHSVRILTPEYRRYTLLISSDDLSVGAENYLLSSVLVNRSAGFTHVADCSSDRAHFEALLEQMKDEFVLKKRMYEESLDAMFVQLLISLYRIRPELFITDFNRNTVIVRDIQSRFERAYSERYDLSTLSAEYHVSPSHLAHIFKGITGYSPIEYLMSCRLYAAKNLLGTTDKSIKEIIDLCGFSDESNFSRMFRSKVGMTPSVFRKMAKNA